MQSDEVEERILLERDGVLAIDKPPGLPTSGLALDDPRCLQHALMERHGGMVWAVHQIDADTTGVNLFVKEKRLVKEFKRQMEDASAHKRYLAVVHGAPDWERKTVHAPIGLVDERSLGVHPDGKSAHSEFRVHSHGQDAALIEARIFTGRTHQIRIHLAHLGHPLIGEGWYRNPPSREHPRQALHAWRMELETLTLEAPIPEDLLGLMREKELSLVE